MRGRTAVTGDEGEHLVEVEERGVGGREVTGDEHEGGVGLGDARCGDAAELRDDALRHVVEVGCALPHVAAHADEQVAELAERLEHGALGVGTAVDPGVHVVEERRVLRHERLRLEHGLGVAAGELSALVEVLGHGGECLGDGVLRVVRGAGQRVLRGFAERVRHAEHGAVGDATADAGAEQFGHSRLLHLHALTVGVVRSVRSDTNGPRPCGLAAHYPDPR